MKRSSILASKHRQFDKTPSLLPMPDSGFESLDHLPDNWKLNPTSFYVHCNNFFCFSNTLKPQQASENPSKAHSFGVGYSTCSETLRCWLLLMSAQQVSAVSYHVKNTQAHIKFVPRKRSTPLANLRGKQSVMELLPITEALAIKSFDKIADICDNLMLQVASEGISFHDDWPYAIHLLGYFYVDDCDSARFLWKTIPTSVKESKPEVIAAWRIGQKLWTRDYAGVYEAIRGYDWSQEAKDMVAAFSDVYTKRMFQLLLSAYSTISIHGLALFLGMTEDDATTYVVENGWTVDAASQMATVKKQAVKREQKVDSSKLQRLTEYVFHLEH